MIEILIADDEKLIRAGIAKMISKSIENIELKIVEAKNGQEALEICKTDEPQVLITDIRMPIMDGVELIVALMILFMLNLQYKTEPCLIF